LSVPDIIAISLAHLFSGTASYINVAVKELLKLVCFCRLS